MWRSVATQFGYEHEANERVAEAAWGTGTGEAGLEQGRNLTPIGGSSFDVEEDGSVVVLDEANRRLLRWRGDGETPDAVPLAINGTLADMSIGGDGTIYVLETTGAQAAEPLLRSFGRHGAAKSTVAVANMPSQVRVGPDGPVVLQSSSAQWMPAARDGRPVGVSGQIDAAESGRPLSDGRRIVILRSGNEVRACAGRKYRRSAGLAPHERDASCRGSARRTVWHGSRPRNARLHGRP